MRPQARQEREAYHPWYIENSSEQKTKEIGGFFQQPLRLDGDIHKCRYRIRPLFIRHSQLEPVGALL